MISFSSLQLFNFDRALASLRRALYDAGGAVVPRDVLLDLRDLMRGTYIRGLVRGAGGSSGKSQALRGAGGQLQAHAKSQITRPLHLSWNPLGNPGSLFLHFELFDYSETVQRSTPIRLALN